MGSCHVANVTATWLGELLGSCHGDWLASGLLPGLGSGELGAGMGMPGQGGAALKLEMGLCDATWLGEPRGSCHGGHSASWARQIG